MLKAMIVTVALLVSAAVFAGPAQAASCSLGAGPTTTNRVGMTVVYSQLRVYGGNCASAQYVMNRWIRRHWRNTWSNTVRTNFWDGYVRWHCSRRGYRWTCEEYDSWTSFSWKAVLLDY